VSFKSLTESGWRFGWSLVVWQIVPCPWADNRESPVGWLATVVNLTGGTARWLLPTERRGRRHSWVVDQGIVLALYKILCLKQQLRPSERAAGMTDVHGRWRGRGRPSTTDVRRSTESSSPPRHWSAAVRMNEASPAEQHSDVARLWCQGGHIEGHDEHGGLRAEPPPAGSRGRASGQGVKGRSPPKLNRFIAFENDNFAHFCIIWKRRKPQTFVLPRQREEGAPHHAPLNVPLHKFFDRFL